MKSSSHDSLTQKIIDFLKQRIDPCLESEILAAVSGRRKDKIEVIRLLRSKGLIEFSGQGKKGSPFFYSLPTVAENLSINSPIIPTVQEPKNESTEIIPESNSIPIYKKYSLPNGNILSLTREQFDEIVELFRLLLKQSYKKAVSKS